MRKLNGYQKDSVGEVSATLNRFVPTEYQRVVCPYCGQPQNELNIEKQMYTQTKWVSHTCEKCKKLFGYIQIVERAYITAAVKE